MQLPKKKEDTGYFRVRAYIDEKALRHNIKVVKEKIGPQVLMAGVVKADAYGHGICNIAPILEEEGVNYFAVATLEEALELRELGTKLPVLILGYTDPDQYSAALQNQIHITIYSEEQAERLSKAAGRVQQTGLVHIKLETGMGRIGFPCDEDSVLAIQRIMKLPHLSIDGIFTHFARADEADKSQAAKQQQRYNTFLDKLAKADVAIPIHHTANSAAIMEYKAAYQKTKEQGDYPYEQMARAGVMLYGLYPSKEMDIMQTELKPVMSLVSHVIHIKEVPAGTPIGYGGSYVAPSNRRIATIPVGYGDGYPRRLSNLGYVMIRGKRAAITGRICMDQFMVDVTDIPQAALGDEVVLIGEGVTAEALAQLTDTIHYELVCQLTKRVPRILK